MNIAMPGYVGPIDRSQEAIDSCTAIIKHALELKLQQRYSEAIEVLDKAVQEHPTWTPLVQCLTHLYIETKQADQARQGILRLHELGHKDPDFSAMLGIVLMGQRQLGEAILAFREAKALGAEAGKWRLALGEALLRTGRLEEAEGIFEELKDTIDGRELARLYVDFSALRLKQKRYEETVHYALEALRAKRAKNTVFCLMGLAFMRMGDHERAMSAFQEYAQRQPNRVGPYRFLERLAREAGDDEQADAYNLVARQKLEDRRLLRVEKQRLASRQKP